MPRYAGITLYRGEADPSEDFQVRIFNSIRAAATWLTDQGYAPNIAAATTGISNVVRGKVGQYKGFTISYKEE